jgi:hypothetical protein
VLSRESTRGRRRVPRATARGGEPRGLGEPHRRCARRGLGYGGLFVSGAVRAALEEIGWDPPRIATTAFMQYIWGFEQFEVPRESVLEFEGLFEATDDY